MMRNPGDRYFDGGRLSRMLAQMPDSNNGSAAGGIGSVLQKALQGYMMGQDMQQSADAQAVMKQAGEAMAGKAAVPDAPGPTVEGEAGYTVPGKAPNRNLAAQLMMGNERTAPMGYDMMAQDAARAAEAQQWEQRFGMQNAAQDARFDKELAIKREDRLDERGYRDQVRQDEQGFRKEMLGLQRSMQREPMVQIRNPVDGKGMYVPQSEAYGAEPYSPRTAVSAVIGQDENGNPIYGSAPKPMPATALKMQQEELDAIGAASSMRADMGAVKKSIEGGNLSLGPVQNILSKVKNAAGMSDENSRNFSSFQSSLEKMRNESLRLNKGVQTEGDSVRAWNELVANINDPEVVKQRLAEIDRLNERAAGLRGMNIDAIRGNYGLQPMDTSGYRNVAPAIGTTGLTPDEDAELKALRARFGR